MNQVEFYNRETKFFDYETEAAVLGGMLIYKDSVHRAMNILGVDGSKHFYDVSLAMIYEAFVTLVVKDNCDLWSENVQGFRVVMNWIGRNQGGDVTQDQKEALWSLPDFISRNVEYWAKLVLDYSRRRQAAESFRELGIETVSGVSTEDIIRHAREALSLLDVDAHSAPKPLSEIQHGYLSHVDDILAGKASVERLQTGFRTLDRLTTGYGPGNVAIIAARPGRGKTALAINITRNLGIHGGRHVLFFSLEMSVLEIFNRLVACTGNIVINNLYRDDEAESTQELVQATADRISKASIFFQDKSGSSIESIKISILSHVACNGMPSVIIIDYLQLLVESNKSENRQQEISSISRKIKEMAIELGVPFIVLSQLRRLRDGERDTKPKLSHLRESGSIEQDADTVLLLHRLPVQDKVILQADLAKNRHGEEGSFQIEFDMPRQSMTELGCNE